MRIVVTGAGGQAGRALIRAARAQGVACDALRREDLDITDDGAVASVLAPLARAAGAVINLAAYTNVDRAESEPDAAFRVNAEGAGLIARTCAESGTPLVHVSTDYVFDGAVQREYAETDPVRPLNVYGLSKAAGEDAVRAAAERHVILRTSWLFGPGPRNFVMTMLRLAERGEPARVVGDEVGCPTGTDALADVLLTVAAHAAVPDFDAWGTIHFRGSPPISRAAFARAIHETAERLIGLRAPGVTEITSAEFGAPARRPAHAVLRCDRISELFGIEPPHWHDSLDAMLRELARGGNA